MTLACRQGSLPVAWRLYLPRVWAEDAARRRKAGVPDEVQFATKPQIALAQLERLLEQGAPRHCVLADAGYGVDTAFRERLGELGLPYVVGVTGQVTLCPPGLGRLLSVKDLAFELPAVQWQTLAWREGDNAVPRSRFARVRVRTADRDRERTRPRAEQWLLIEWPAGHEEPMQYWLSTLAEDLPLERMVLEARMRWRVERDHRDLEQEVGLGHYEGRGWRGFHHHASLSIAAYGLRMAQQLRHPALHAERRTSGGLESAPARQYR